MPNLTQRHISHLTSDDRTEIQDCLYHGMTFKAITKRIGKDQTTVSKEVKKHIHVKDAVVTNAQPCGKLMSAPFVCNACSKRRYCKLERHFYYAKEAQDTYKASLSECRSGVALSKEEFYESDKIIAAGIRNGQHIYHIAQTNSLSFSKSSFYRYLHKGYLSISPINMPRVVKFKQRNTPRTTYVPKKLKEGRTYDCFQAYINENGIDLWVEMDTVIGCPGGKVIMTFDFTLCNFMFGLLLDNKASATVAEAIGGLKQRISDAGLKFCDTFPLLLTDNGSEFSDVYAFENDLDGNCETRLFFCDPYTPSQKPRVEKNHTLFRDIVPKGYSFDDFTQDTVNVIFSHVNAVARKSLYGKTPYEFFTYTFSEQLAQVLGITAVAPQDVVQSPLLLRD